MHIEAIDPPAGLCRAYPPCIAVLLDLIDRLLICTVLICAVWTVIALHAKTRPVATLVDVLEDVFACLHVCTDLDIDVGVVFGRQIWVVWHHPAILLGIILRGLSRPAPTVFGVSEVWFKDSLIVELLWKLLTAFVFVFVPASRWFTGFGGGIMAAIAMDHTAGHRGIEIRI